MCCDLTSNLARFRSSPGIVQDLVMTSSALYAASEGPEHTCLVAMLCMLKPTRTSLAFGTEFAAEGRCRNCEFGSSSLALVLQDHVLP